MSNGVHHSILSTLALAHAEGQTSLSLQEIAACLHKNSGEHRETPSLLETAQELSFLVNDGCVVRNDGRFFLVNKKRIGVGEDFSEEKMRHARATLSFLSAVPFVRSLAVTGSVSFGNAKKESDLDILLLAKKNRLWTARLFSLAVMELAQRRRDAQGKERKICLNYLLAEDAVPIAQNIASANLFKHAIPIFGTSVFLDFIKRNKWIGELLYHPEPNAPHRKEKKGGAFFLSFIQACTEFLLPGIIGSFVEKQARAWQEKRLNKKKVGQGNSPHFFFSESVIALHYPDSKNEKVMTEYKNTLAVFSPEKPR